MIRSQEKFDVHELEPRMGMLWEGDPKIPASGYFDLVFRIVYQRSFALDYLSAEVESSWDYHGGIFCETKHEVSRREKEIRHLEEYECLPVEQTIIAGMIAGKKVTFYVRKNQDEAYVYTRSQTGLDIDSVMAKIEVKNNKKGRRIPLDTPGMEEKEKLQLMETSVGRRAEIVTPREQVYTGTVLTFEPRPENAEKGGFAGQASIILSDGGKGVLLYEEHIRTMRIVKEEYY